MRILFLKCDPYLPDLYAGVEVNTHWLCRALIERGHDVAVVAARWSLANGVIGIDHEQGYPVYRASNVLAALHRAAEHFRPDVAVLQNCLGNDMTDALGRDHAVPVVHYEHAIYKGPELRTADWRGSALWIANSALLARHLRTRFGVGSAVVPPLFGIDRFGAVARAPKHVLMVSVQPHKGADIALALAASRPDTPFVFIENWSDDKPGSAILKQKLAELPNVTLMTNLADLTPVYAETRLLLMPSRSQETWGRTATECQLLGIPVLASNRGSLPATVGRGGLTVDPDGPLDDWTAAFDRICSDERHMAAFSTAAREHATAMLRLIPETIERFEACIRAVVPTSWPADARLVATPRQPRKPPFIERRDLALLLDLQRQRKTVESTYMQALPALADVLSSDDPVNDGVRDRISRALGVAASPDAGEIARQALACRRETLLQCLKGQPGWMPAMSISGQAHLDEALEAGRGAVLWVNHLAFASNIVKMALHAAGYAIAQLSRPEHGLSKTRFGMRFLNPARTEFEDRFLDRRILFDRRRPARALLEARSVLKAGGIVAMTAGAWEGGRIIEMPFLGATLRLAIGPVRLALLTGAALLPVSAKRVAGTERFDVRVAAPIRLGCHDTDEMAWRHATAQFAAHVAYDAISSPAQWRGWSALA